MIKAILKLMAVFPSIASWRTFFLGVIVMITSLLNNVAVPLLDGDPATGINMTIIFTGIAAAAGLMFAKDSDK